jgi:hypothetical protein
VRYPTVCLDEKPVVRRADERADERADVRAGLPLAPGHVERRDVERRDVERHGAANLFVMVEPLAGWRHVAVTAQRTKQDYADCLRYLVEERSPEAESICVVQDNRNTPTAGALYETVPPQQARAILRRLRVCVPLAYADRAARQRREQPYADGSRAIAPPATPPTSAVIPPHREG